MFKKNKIIVITLLVFLLLFLLLNIFFSTNGFVKFINKNNYLYTIIPAISILVALFAIGFGSSTLQFSSNNPLASPLTIGIFPALTFSYLVSSIYGFSTNEWLKLLLNIFLTFIVLAIYLIIDLKTSSSSKIIFSFTLSISLSAISMILYTKYGLSKTGSLLFSLNKLDMSNLKMWMGIGMIVFGLVMIIFIKNKIHIYSIDRYRAASLGVNIKKMKVLSLVAISLLFNGSYVMFGILSFVGLIIPNIVKLIGFNKFFTSSIISGIFSSVIGLVAYFLSNIFLMDMFIMYSIISIPFIVVIFLRIRKVVYVE